jgi:FkbM family methyltransferase
VNIDFDPKENITNSYKPIMLFKKLINKINDLRVIHRIVNNWYDIVLFRTGLKRPRFVMQLRNGKKIEIKKPQDYFLFWESKEGEKALLKQMELELVLKQFSLGSSVKVIEKKKVIEFKFGNKKLKFNYDSKKQLYWNTLGMIKEQFIGNQYRWLNVKNRVVVDIGANIGDSAIYFDLKGAKHVYAFEPYPYSYDLAMRNIRLNGLQDKITLLNEGCGEKNGKIRIKSSYKNLGSTDLKNFKNGTNIRITTLGELVKRFGIRDNAVLKIDCEGCEYGVLLKSQNSDLRRFKQILVEYHYGYLNIEKRLKDSGFKVTKTIPKYVVNSQAENKEMIVGLIYALKI